MLNINPQNKHMTDDFAYVLDSFYIHTSKIDQYVSYCCRNGGVWEPELTQWMINNIQKGWRCLDIGFNIGYHTEVLARITGSTGKVWAFEPNKELIDRYEEARKLNSYDDCAEIEVFPYALSDDNFDTVLYVPITNVGHATLGTFDETDNHIFTTRPAEAKRLDSFFDQPVDFIKIDIEGHEPQAWAGFPESVKQCPLIVAELGPYHSFDFLEWIDETYHMSRLNGEDVNLIDIYTESSYIDVVLKKK